MPARLYIYSLVDPVVSPAFEINRFEFAAVFR